jgi:hypothetical protein
MSKPHCCANFIAFKATCEPCPSKINRWQLDGNMPLGIDLIKNENFFEHKTNHPCFFFIAMHVL